MKNNTLWFDITNTPNVNFFEPIIKRFSNYNQFITARSFGETVNYLKSKGIEPNVFGEHAGKSKYKKINNYLNRLYNLTFKLPNFDISFSSNYDAPFITLLKRKISIVFDDNDISPNYLYGHIANYVFIPDSIEIDLMVKSGVKKNKIFRYPGFKENIYIADYLPNNEFLKEIPFQKYIVVRPENLFATYVTGNIKSIVPELIDNLLKAGYNIVYLPRYKVDREYINPDDKLFIPNKPLNGLDLCYFSDAVLTGAGSFSREAALLGVPAVSFFAGETLLAVDKLMKQNEMVFFSRNVEDIINFVNNCKKREFDLSSSKISQKELFDKLDDILNKL